MRESDAQTKDSINMDRRTVTPMWPAVIRQRFTDGVSRAHVLDTPLPDLMARTLYHVLVVKAMSPAVNPNVADVKRSGPIQPNAVILSELLPRERVVSKDQLRVCVDTGGESDVSGLDRQRFASVNLAFKAVGIPAVNRVKHLYLNRPVTIMRHQPQYRTGYSGRLKHLPLIPAVKRGEYIAWLPASIVAKVERRADISVAQTEALSMRDSWAVRCRVRIHAISP